MVTILKKDWSKIARTAEADKKGIAHHLEDRLSGLGIKRQFISEAARRANLNIEAPASWTDEDFYRFVDNLRRISKPLLIVANKIDLPTAQANVERLKKLDYIVIPCSAEAELVLRRAAEKQLIDYKPGDKDFKITHPEKLSAGQIKALEQVKEKILKPNGVTGVQEAIKHRILQTPRHDNRLPRRRPRTPIRPQRTRPTRRLPCSKRHHRTPVRLHNPHRTRRKLPLRHKRPRQTQNRRRRHPKRP